MHYSINYFKDIRTRIDSIFRKMIASGAKDIIIWGDGEVAELSFLSMRGLPLNLVGVIDRKRVDNGFFGHNIYSFEDFPSLKYDAILVSSFGEEEKQKIESLDADMRKVYSL